MPDPTKLKLGDLVMFVALPEEWQRKTHFVPQESIVFMKKMIARKHPSRISEIDDSGYPWIKARIVERGKINYHSWLITEYTGWRLVQRRSK